MFSSAGANRLARSLFVALRDRAVSLPDDPELVSELQTVRMVETGPGVVKMSNPPGTHDDAATAVGMIVADLADLADLADRADRADSGPVRFHVAPGRIQSATVDRLGQRTVGGPSVPSARDVRIAARRGPSGVPFVVGVPGAYDDPRRPGGAVDTR